MAAVSHRPASSVCADFNAVIFLFNAFTHVIIIDPPFPPTRGNSGIARY